MPASGRWFVGSWGIRPCFNMTSGTKKTKARTTCGLLLAMMGSLVATCSALAQDPASLQSFVSGMPEMLFDGQSLDGWGRRDGSPNPGWDIDDGALHRTAGGGDLYYKDTLGDFELYFQWRIAAGGNSGLKYRVRDYGGNWLGCEYQLLDDNKHQDANKTAGLYDIFDPPEYRPVVIPGTWNDSRILVCGNRIEHWLNGVMTVQTTTGSSAWKRAVAESKFSDVPGFGENRTGLLFLQDHGDEIWFRELVLIPLIPMINHPIQEKRFRREWGNRNFCWIGNRLISRCR